MFICNYVKYNTCWLQLTQDKSRDKKPNSYYFHVLQNVYVVEFSDKTDFSVYPGYSVMYFLFYSACKKSIKKLI